MAAINKNYVHEYKAFLHKYLLPLLGITLSDKAVAKLEDKKIPKGDTVFLDGEKLYFRITDDQGFVFDCHMLIPEDTLAVCRRILQDFSSIATYRKTGSQRNLGGNVSSAIGSSEPLYQAVLQNGICRWLLGDAKANVQHITRLFNELETWSVKTYEGKRVTLGFVIDPEKTSSFGIAGQTWLDFLHNDAAAILTDCIYSVIELDGACNFVAYHSLSQTGSIPNLTPQHTAPLRFAQVIQTYVTGKARGIFLLNNGDIVLSKDGKVCFVRRNLRWLNLSYDAFENALHPFIKAAEKAGRVAAGALPRLLQSIYASVLDVSFSHAGGIIAICGDSSDVDTTQLKDIIAPSDNLLSETAPTDREIRDQRALKKCLLRQLVGHDKFPEIDRKLRGELLGLDGACILDYDGTVRSFGAIIQNDSGSAGGGRGAAASKLSKYGMAVKISTDGYVELYHRGDLIYAIK